MTDNHLFSSILLGGRDGTNPGQLKVDPGGIAWRKQGGGKIIEIDKANIARLTWMEVPRAYQLGVGLKDGLFYKFIGFREQDVSNLTNFIQKNIGVTPEEKQLSTSGHNWGEVDINGNMLTFLVGSRQAFEISLADVAQTQLQGKTDVHLEFHVDDTTGATEVFLDKIVSLTDVGSSEEAVVTFEGIAILTPRGQYSLELRVSFLHLQGLVTDFKILYSSVARLFVLPKFNQPYTFVIITLDPPIRKGHTLHPHIVIQFETEYVVARELALNEELLTTRYKDKLEPSYKGLIHDVFTKILRGLSGVKIKFVEFERHGAGGSSVSSHYFDLLVKLKNEQEHLFRNIQRNEYHNLFEFIKGKGMKILNLGDAKTTSGVTAALQDDDDDAVDPHLERIKNAAGEESDEEDEDFVAEKDDGGSPTDDSGEEESDASESGNEKKFSNKDTKKEAAGVKVVPSKKKSNYGDEESSKKRKQKRKKDPNAPKRVSGFMFF